MQERLGFLTRDLSNELQRVQDYLEKATSFAHLYQLATNPMDRKDLLRQVFARIEVSQRTIQHIEYRPPFDLLLGQPSEVVGSMDSLAHVMYEQVTNKETRDTLAP